MEILFIIFLVLIDQITKFWVRTGLGDKTISLVNNYLEFVYVENRGAAFGLFQNNKMILVGITSLVIVAMIFYLMKNRKVKLGLKISLILIIGGAIGNLIDRIYLSYVVDFIHFYIRDVFDWPVFNVADISVVCGTILLAINVIFDKELKVE